MDGVLCTMPFRSMYYIYTFFFPQNEHHTIMLPVQYCVPLFMCDEFVYLSECSQSRVIIAIKRVARIRETFAAQTLFARMIAATYSKEHTRRVGFRKLLYR